MSDLEVNKIKELFRGDLKGLFAACKPYGQYLSLKLLKWSLLPSIIFTLLLIFLTLDNEKLIDIVEGLIKTGFSMVGVILGLSLAGFILIVSYGNQRMIDRAVQSQVDKYAEKGKLEYSYLQKGISKFALIVVIQFFSFMLFFVLTILSNVEFTSPVEIAIKWNLFFSWIISFVLLYTINLTFQLVLNIFTLSQSSSLQLFTDKHEEMSNQSEED